MLDAIVGVSAPRVTALKQANQPIPNSIRIRVLVDTGASCTFIDESILSTDLGLTPTGQSPVTVANGVTEDRDEYDVGLAIPPASPHDTPMVFGTIRVMATPLRTTQGFDALLGRDILSMCILHYNGTAGLFTLAY